MENTSAVVTIYTDGACSGNPGVGGYGAILIYGKHTKEIYGGEPLTTNNQMELKAVIEALRCLKKTGLSIVIYTDSTYVQQGITSWLPKWQKNGWKTSANKPVKNIELWQELYQLSQSQQISWQWVKGHNNNFYNEMADQLAKRYIEMAAYQ